MVIVYRRTGGVLALLILGVVVLAVTVLTTALVGVLLLVGIAVGAAALLARAVLPRSRWSQPVPPPTAWPRETIEASVVAPMPTANATDGTTGNVTSASRLHP